TTGNGLVSDFTAEGLQKFGIPTLEDVFQLVSDQCEINIEIKTYDTTQGVLGLMEQHPDWKNRVVISSFDWNILQEVRFHDNEIRLGVLTETDLDSAFAFAKFIRAYSIHPDFHLLTAENTNKLQKAGFLVFPWTVNDPEDIIFVKSLRVDGIITDYPDRI
ncbi:MAG: glycerophosphodiester phosphodiesterase, partial [Flavobacterium sp.]